MKKVVGIFIAGFMFALIGLQLIDCVSTGISALSQWFLSLVNVHTSANNANVIREQSKAQMYTNNIPDISYREDDNGDDNYL